VSGTGLPLEPPEIVIRSSGHNLYTPSVPAVAYASHADKYLVIWEETWHPMPLSHSIRAQVLRSWGELEGSDFDISQDPGDGTYRLHPDLAYNRSRNEYLVAWEQRDPGNGDYDIRARRVQGNGSPMFPESFGLVGGVGDELAPAVAAVPTSPNQGRYLVAFEDHRTPSDVDIRVRLVSGEGSVQNIPQDMIAASNEDEKAPAVAGSENGRRFLVTWTRYETDPQAPWVHWELIYSRPIGAGGNFLGPGIHTGGRYDSDHSAVSAGAAGDFLVVFDDDPWMANDWDIYGRLWGNRVYVPVQIRRRP
jgi:hypothetical protein